MIYDQRPPLLARVVAAAIDIVLALVLTVVSVVATTESTLDVREPLALSLVVGLAMPLPLAVRRRWPMTVLVFVVLVCVLAIVMRWLPTSGAAVTYFVTALALHSVAASRSRIPAIVALISTIAAINVSIEIALAITRQGNQLDLLAASLALTVVQVSAWSIGRATRARRLYLERVAERALTDERLRIARDLHDGIAHSLSLITVQASVANHVAAERPEEARSALTVIESTGRDALRELRRMLGLLRTEDEHLEGGAPGTEAASLEPAPTADRLAELAEGAARAGVRVELHIDGVDAVPAAVGLSVYRIVQESLTNVVKHAAPARCWVRVTADEGEVEVEVTDDGNRATGGLPGGHGLIGMRERVSLFAGEFSAGRMPGGGFQVYAKMPLESAPT